LAGGFRLPWLEDESMKRPDARPRPVHRATRWLGAWAALAVVAVCGCGGSGETSSSGGSGLAGTVTVEGSSTVFRISQAAQVGFKQIEPSIKVLVGSKGTGTGFSSYLQGEIDIVDASRPAKPEEESEAKAKGLDWTRFLVGYDGITVVVHKDNAFVQSLTVDQLRALFEPNSQVKTWKQLNPSWPDRKINLFAPDNDSGTFEFFAEAINGQKAQRRDGVQTSADDNTLVSGVAGDPDGLGYFGYAYFVKNQSRLRSVPIQSGADAPPVEPTPESILNGSYRPLSRPLYIYVKNDAMKRPEVAAFVRYYLENSEELATKADYVSPTTEDQNANREALNQFQAAE
jgi:phosphate transport system substrate-binding protein